MTVSVIRKLRYLLPALLFTLRAPGVKFTAQRRIHRTRDIPFEQDPLPAPVPGVRRRNCGEQCLCVRVQCPREQLLRRGYSTMFPRYITPMRSLIYFTTLKSCVINRYVRCSCSFRSISRFNIWDWIETSSADTASSQTTKRGFKARLLAIPIRCR